MTFAGRDISRTDLAVLPVLVVVFVLFALRYSWFALDDAFITLRYSQHLAAGHGIVWNVGADPVEGYTSTLFMAIATVPHLLGIDPMVFLDALSVGAGVALIVGVYRYGLVAGASRHLTIVAAAALAVNPASALLAVQGLGTVVAMVFPFLAAVYGIKIARQVTRRDVLVLACVLVLGTLARPGLGVFAAVLMVSLAIYVYRERGLQPARTFVGYGVPIPVVAGALYLLGRRAYFGHWFPNPFYVKSDGGMFSTIGITYVAGFLSVVVGVVIILAVADVLYRDRDDERLFQVLPVAAATGTFLALWFFIDPMQGYFWRFQMPVLPAILVVVLYVAGRSRVDRGRLFYADRIDGDTVAQLLVVALLLTGVLFPLHALDDTEVFIESHDHVVRANVGESLEPLGGEDYRMFVTESGAIPYYSGWTASDSHGLNSEEIAHDGLTVSYLESYSPDLVVLQSGFEPGMLQKKSSVTATYLNDSDYDLVAVIQNSNAYLYALVDRDSAGYTEISCSLLHVDGVSYMPRDVAVELADSDVRASPITRSDCDDF
jgi:hypothetical protein